MAKANLVSVLYTLLLAVLVHNSHSQEQKVQIVYMGEKPEEKSSLTSSHRSMLSNLLGSKTLARQSLVYSYENFNGFAANLTDEHAAKLSKMEGVVSVMPNRVMHLQTTRSWNFMGFPEPNISAAKQENITVGVLDTGIWPESKSFNDQGFPPPPARWRGKCTGENFTCNNKIIGARSYNSEGIYGPTDIGSPIDSEGHGTHTSSTAAGDRVAASYFGLAPGIARGGVPNSRIAVYKVCWSFGCASADILKAFDDCIHDGVDFISASLGFDGILQYFEDPIAIGSFHALRYGILTSCSAGNSGPSPRTVSNYAPWQLTVAASTIDRRFVAEAETGTGQSYCGLSIQVNDLGDKPYPLIWGGDAPNVSAGCTSDTSRYCSTGTLDATKVAGKIVLCESTIGTITVREANGAGCILTTGAPDNAFNYFLPTTAVTGLDIEEIQNYIRSTRNPIAIIRRTETRKDVMAPYVASFSSRGPNPITPDITKPDLTAPGVDILAAWTPLASPSVDPADPRSVKYNIISGTSMSCPHATGAAAYVKAAHPQWSPAAIKSALMTTASTMDPRKNEDREFAYGSGQLNPSQAIDPGLVYNTTEADYVNFLCKQGYNTTTVRLITGSNTTVCNSTGPGRAWDLNYPSFSVAMEDGQKIYALFNRTVTNVGSARSTYRVRVNMPFNVSISVKPQVLSFSRVGEQQSYTIIVSGPRISQQPIMSGSITWSDGKHMVRSPVVMYTTINTIVPDSVNATDSRTQ